MSDMRTISDLIRELEFIKVGHGDLPVLVDGYEMDYDQARKPKVVYTADKGAETKKDEWWSGRYIEEPEHDDRDLPRFNAVVIPR